MASGGLPNRKARVDSPCKVSGAIRGACGKLIRGQVHQRKGKRLISTQQRRGGTPGEKKGGRTTSTKDSSTAGPKIENASIKKSRGKGQLEEDRDQKKPSGAWDGAGM